MTLEQRLVFQQQVIRHDTNVLRWFRNHPIRSLTLETSTRRIRVLYTRQRLARFHYFQRRWTRREAGETLVALVAKRARVAAAEAAVFRARRGDVSAWLCIHNREAPWDYDPKAPGHNGVYYGGLQMDWEFMSTYGASALGFPSWDALLAAKGAADHWTPDEQMVVAEYARASGRGYFPWPNTARYCGLI